MNEKDKIRFAKAMVMANAPYGVTLDRGLMEGYFNCMIGLTIEEVEASVIAHLSDPEDCKFPPKPGLLIKQAMKPKKAACVSPDEAWLIASAAVDEANTAVWSDAIRDAFFSIDHTQYNASTCFKTEYKRILEERNYDQGKWTISPGTEPQLRSRAIEDAVVAGRITHEYAQKALPSPPMTFEQTLKGMVQAQKQISSDKPHVDAAAKQSIERFLAYAKEAEMKSAAKEKRLATGNAAISEMRSILNAKPSAKGYASGDRAEAKRLAEEALKTKKVIGDE